MIVLNVSFYFKNGFQQVKDEYTGFMTIKELFDIHFVITQKCESFWLDLFVVIKNQTVVGVYMYVKQQIKLFSQKSFLKDKLN